MKIGNKIVNFSVYGEIDGKLDYLDDTTNLQLPAFEMLTDTLKGAGIMGEIDWPSYLGLSSSTFTVSIRVDGKKAAFLSSPGKKRFEVRWVTDKFDSSNVNIGVVAHKSVILGVPKKYDPGKIETGSTQDGSLEFEVFYYKKTEDGQEVIEIDKFNYIYRVNGVDYSADIRSLL